VYYGKSNGAEKIGNADDLCMYLLNTAHVSTVTGRAFGTPNCIRLSFANSLEKIEEAYRRIKKALGDLKD
jgi:aspartate aminotransferase